jgi:hypothetical protein
MNLLKKYPFYYRVSTAGDVRFESLFQEEAEKHVSGIYQEDKKTIAQIDEVPRG